MADVSKIKLPDGTSYNIKDNSQTRSDHMHYGSDMVPLVHKKYESTSYYATTASTWEHSTWYFMSIKPDSWDLPWRIKLKVHSYCPNYSTYQSYTWSTVCGRADGIIYANWNERYDTAHYYYGIYPLKKAGFDAGYGHALGISILYGSNYTVASYYRTFEIDYYECENCTVTILDTPVKWSNWTGTGTTNYGSLVSLDAANRGLRESGDDNTVTENRIGYFAGKTGNKGVWAASLFMEDVNGTYQNICTASDGTVTANNRTAATTKIANTNGFKVGSSIWYTNTTYNANTNISNVNVVYSSISLFDTRYSFNTTLTAGSLTVYKPLYLVGTIDPIDNLYYLDTVWWTQTPNDPDKVYVLVGGVYDSTTSNCRATLYEQNKWYRYDEVYELVEIVNEANMVNGHTVDKDVPSGAEFTDTTYGISVDGANVKLTAGGTGTTAGLSDLINGLGEGTSPAQLNDYLIAQYAGGGTTTKTYHRRAVKNVVNKTVVDNALGKGSDTTKYYRNDGTWATPTNTDTKVTQSLVSDNYNRPLLMAAAQISQTTTDITDASRRANTMYANASTGTISATKYRVGENVTLEYNSATQSLDFIFS